MPDFTFTLDPPPGINTDDTTFAVGPGRWADSDGFRFYLGKAQTIGGVSQLSLGAIFTNTRKLLTYKVGAAINYAAAGSALIRNSTVITPASGWSAGRHCLAMWGDNLLATVSGGKLFESVAGAQAVEIANAPDQITVMLVTPSRQVMAAGCNEEVSGTFNGRCIRWSDIEDNTDWTTSNTNNAGEYILPGQKSIVAGTVFGNDVLIWTESALWLVQFIGDPGNTFSFTQIADVGCIGLDAHAILDGVVYWLAPDWTFHSYQLGGLPAEIPCPIIRDIQGTYELDYKNKTIACRNSAFGEVWFSYVHDDTEPERYIVYCVRESILAGRPVWFKGVWANLSANTTYIGAMLDDDYVRQGSGTSRTPLVVAPYGTSLRLYTIDGALLGPTSSYIQTADQYVEEGRRRVMAKHYTPDFEYRYEGDGTTGDVTVTISTRSDPLGTASDTAYTLGESETKKSIRKSGKLIRIKFAPETQGRLRLGKQVFDCTTMGFR